MRTGERDCKRSNVLGPPRSRGHSIAAVELRQAVRVGGEVRRHPVEQHAQARGMRALDEAHRASTRRYQTLAECEFTDVELALLADAAARVADGEHQAVAEAVVGDALGRALEVPAPACTTDVPSSRCNWRWRLMCEAARLEYLYAIVVRPDGSAYELVSNLSVEQQAERADPMTAILLKPR